MDAGTARIVADYLLTEFAARVDDGEGVRVAELFVKDATVTTPMMQLEGREQINSWFSERARKDKRMSLHSWTNLRIESVEGDCVAYSCNMITFSGEPPLPCRRARMVAGRCYDVVVKDGDQWLFKSRKLELSFEGHASAGETAS